MWYIEEIFGFETGEDILKFMHSDFPLEKFREMTQQIILGNSESEYLYDNNSNLLLAFITWLIIGKYSNLHKDIYPFLKHLERILGELGLTFKDFGITQAKIDYFIIPNQEKAAKRNWGVARDWGKAGIDAREKFFNAVRHASIIKKSFKDLGIDEHEVTDFLQTQAKYFLKDFVGVVENHVGYVDGKMMKTLIDQLQFYAQASGTTLEAIGFTQEKIHALIHHPRYPEGTPPPKEVLKIQARRHLINHGLLPLNTQLGDITDAHLALYWENREKFIAPVGEDKSWYKRGDTGEVFGKFMDAFDQFDTEK